MLATGFVNLVASMGDLSLLGVPPLLPDVVIPLGGPMVLAPVVSVDTATGLGRFSF